MTKTEIAKRKFVNYMARENAIAEEQREAGKRYFEAEKDSKEEKIAWGDLCWANDKMRALQAKGMR